MPAKDNKEMYEQVIKDLNAAKGDIAKIRSTLEKNCAPGFIYHHARRGDMDLDQTVQYFAELWVALPDGIVSIDDLVAEEDKLAVRSTFQGTNEGAYMGIPATGKRIAVTEMQFFKIVGGKAVELWALPDGLSMMIQLGVIPDLMPK